MRGGRVGTKGLELGMELELESKGSSAQFVNEPDERMSWCKEERRRE